MISALPGGDRARAWFPSFVSCLDHYSPRIQEVERQSSFITFDSEKINFPTNYHANFSVRLPSSVSDKKRSANLQRDALSTLPLLRVYARPFLPRLPNERIRFSLPFVILPLRHLSYNHRYSIYNSVLRTVIQSRSQFRSTSVLRGPARAYTRRSIRDFCLPENEPSYASCSL